jgi:hypothetical protein
METTTESAVGTGAVTDGKTDAVDPSNGEEITKSHGVDESSEASKSFKASRETEETREGGHNFSDSVLADGSASFASSAGDVDEDSGGARVGAGVGGEARSGADSGGVFLPTKEQNWKPLTTYPRSPGGARCQSTTPIRLALPAT